MDRFGFSNNKYEATISEKACYNYNEQKAFGLIKKESDLTFNWNILFDRTAIWLKCCRELGNLLFILFKQKYFSYNLIKSLYYFN